MEERLDQIEERQRQQELTNMTMLNLVKGIDGKVDELTGMMRATQIESSIIETRLTTIDRRIDAVKLDMQRSFAQVEATFATKQDLEAGLHAIKKEVLVEMNAMEGRILSAFGDLIDVIKTGKKD